VCALSMAGCPEVTHHITDCANCDDDSASEKCTTLYSQRINLIWHMKSSKFQTVWQ